MITLVYIIYGLHFFSALNGVLSSAFILTAFLTGWPSIIAVIISYAKRGEAVDTYLQSHFEWLIQTFWYALLWLIVSILIALTFFGIPIAFLMIVLTGLWVIYRIIRGVLNLMDKKSMPML
ncbi:MAG: hypothetical protein DIZ80_07800 [endosymbiont of Galathealinum brachiosum]|uniref:DUF4870 domain-containing protein n=1 Tax=endosymbiont of Galathealinum brachiosum TaxID=2200906 RepID=A0A370DGI2_9GAMM|nr:MAG: hypothetical protein DIZ80_07800 [endosymbiont of Galathealinum brachiosum]